jgi:hypothetical protein
MYINIVSSLFPVSLTSQKSFIVHFVTTTTTEVAVPCSCQYFHPLLLLVQEGSLANHLADPSRRAV